MEKTENVQLCELFRNAGVGEIVNFVKEDGPSVDLVVSDTCDNHLCEGCYMDSIYDVDCPFFGSCSPDSRPDGKDVIFALCDSDKKSDVYDDEGDVNVGGDIERLTVADLKMAKRFLEEDLTDLICKFEGKTGVSVKGLGFNKDMSVSVDLDI